MQIQSLFAAFSLTLLAACSSPEPNINTVVVDTSKLKFEPIIIDLCEFGQLPSTQGDWYSCSALTKQDAEKIATHNKIVIDN